MKSDKRRKFTITWPSRWRWNVLDVMKVCNKGNIPTYLFCDLDMSWAEYLRSELNKRGLKVTVTAILLKAIAIAQLKHPAARSTLTPWGGNVILEDVVAGFTVEKYVEGEPIVYFGSIQQPDSKSIEQIARELKDYAELDVTQIPQLDVEHRFAKMPWIVRRFILWSGLIFPAMRLRFMGATFGLSSLGKFGMKTIIPPCASTSTFGIGSVEKRPVVRGGEIVIRPILSVTLNFDHRLIDGAPAARFFNDVRLLLEGGLNEYLPAQEQVSPETPIETTPAQIMNSLGRVIPEIELTEKVSVG